MDVRAAKKKLDALRAAMKQLDALVVVPEQPDGGAGTGSRGGAGASVNSGITDTSVANARFRVR
jgi:hypothetical protein